MLREVEHQQQRVLYGTQFIVREVSDVLAERPSVNCADHLAEHLRWLVGDCDLWVEARCECQA